MFIARRLDKSDGNFSSTYNSVTNWLNRRKFDKKLKYRTIHKKDREWNFVDGISRSFVGSRVALEPL